MYKLGVIGLGVMGEAILSVILKEKKFLPEEVTVFDLDTEKTKKFSYKVNISKDVADLVKNSERVFFAVKPQHYVSAIAGVDFSGVSAVYSIMAGVKTVDLAKNLNFCGGIVRIMPNIPCKLGKGVCGVAFKEVDENEQKLAVDMLSACGAVVVTDENKFDAITSVSGSGPAYVYMFADGMIKGGMNGGLTYAESKALALDTIIGAAEIAKLSDEPLDVLVERVCSKGGTTIEAVNIYRDKNLVGTIVEGVDACRKKSELLGRA